MSHQPPHTPPPPSTGFTSIAQQELEQSRSASPLFNVPLRPVSCVDVPMPATLSSALNNLTANTEATAQATGELGSHVSQLQDGWRQTLDGLQTWSRQQAEIAEANRLAANTRHGGAAEINASQFDYARSPLGSPWPPTS